MARVHPLLEQYGDAVAAMRAAISEHGTEGREDLVATVQLYDALAQAPVGKPPPAPQAGITRVTTVLAVLGFRLPPPDHPGTPADFYLSRGQALHKACELDDKGTLQEASVDPEIVAHVRGWRKFKRDVGNDRSVWWERRVTSTRLGLTGQPDNLRFMRGRRCLLDVKTNKVDAATLYQLALYEALLLDQAVVPAPPQWCGLALLPDDYRVHWYSIDEQHTARIDAQAMLRTYHALVRCRLAA